MSSSTRKPSSLKRSVIVIATIFFSGVILLQVMNTPISTPKNTVAPSPVSLPVVTDMATSKHEPQHAMSVDMSDIDTMVDELAERLRQQFSETIHQVAIQVTLRNLRDDLIRSYPEQGQALFVKIITQAFPEFVDAILQAIALMDEYEAWLQDILLSLNDMNVFEQQGVLWEKRHALFGEAATQIWQEEISAEQERQITMQNTMEILDKSYDTQMQERLYLLQSTFEEAYADKIETMVIEPKGVLSQVFFGFDAVQKDLARMPVEERQSQIDQIRRTMGFPEAQIKRLSVADQKREKRWQNGYAYMAKRAEVEAQYSGDALTLELDKVREAYFAHEAITIKKEEEELGFMRYERPRLYGRN